MKIYHKFALGFLGTCLLLGSLGTSNFKRNLQIEYWTNQIVGSIREEAEIATNLSISLQLVRDYSQEILIKYQEGKISKNQISKDREKIENQLNSFAKNIEKARQASKERIAVIKAGNIQNKQEREERELADLKTIELLNDEFINYKNNIQIFLDSLEQNEIVKAETFFETELTKSFRKNINPLIGDYQESAKAKINDSEKTIEKTLEESRQNILITNILSSLFLVGLYGYIYRSTYPPLKQLKKAAIAIGNGELDTKIVPTNSEDELGVLAKTFNQMTESLKQTTVSNYYLDNTIDSIADSTIVIDKELKISKINRAAIQLLNYSKSELIGKKIEKIITGDVGLNLDYLIESDRFPFHCEAVYQAKDKSRIDVSLSINKIVDRHGNLDSLVCLAKNIAEQKKAEKILKQSERRYTLAAGTINDGLWDWNIKTGQIYFSARWKSILGYSETEIENKLDLWFELLHPENRETFKLKIANYLKNSNNSQFEITYRMRHKNGSYRWITCRANSIIDERAKKVERLIGAITDITDRKIFEEKFHHETLHDSLTGLPNQTFFLKRIKELITSAKKPNNSLFAAMYIDLNSLLEINGTLGYLDGDSLLIKIGNRLKKFLPNTTIARLRGDRFAIILEDLKSASNANKIAEQIIDRLTTTVKINERQISIFPTIAIVIANKYYSRSADLIQDLDTALYDLKLSGQKTGYNIYQPAMQIKVSKQRELERDLPAAIANKEFKIFYQPIVRLSGNKIAGFEALMRWQHPEKGLISPADFMPVAKQTGTLLSINWLIMENACARMARWKKEYSLPAETFISINVSSIQFFEKDFIAKIHKLLQKTGFKNSCLQLEITEKVIREDREKAKSILQQLKSLDIKIAIDNFSHEDSCLSYVSNLPINRLKIDRSFFKNINIDRKRLKVMQAIVNLSLELGIEPIAAEIETNEELDKLKELKCQYVQGYLFSRPLNQKSASALIAEKYDRVNSI